MNKYAILNPSMQNASTTCAMDVKYKNNFVDLITSLYISYLLSDFITISAQ